MKTAISTKEQRQAKVDSRHFVTAMINTPPLVLNYLIILVSRIAGPDFVTKLNISIKNILFRTESW